MFLRVIFYYLYFNIAGLVRDVTNSYDVCINTLNGLTTFACIIPWVLEHAVVRMRSRSSAREGS